MNTDPIADLLTRIRNAVRSGKTSVSLPHSSLKEGVARILEQEGFIEKSRIDRTDKFPILSITLKENVRQMNLKRISKPGRRVYQKSSDIRPVKNGFGISILSTSKGLMTGITAKESLLGGEVICEVY